jgi:hypothetical protein
MADWWQPLVGVSVGWGLGQATEWWRQLHIARRYRLAIYVELRDAHSTLKTRIGILRHILESFIENQTLDGLPSDIKFPIFESHFANVSLHFTESERLSFGHLYARVEELNSKFSIMRSCWDFQSGVEDKDRDNLRKIIQIAEGSYIDAREIDAMIELLIKKQKRFDIRDKEDEERLNRVGVQATDEIKAMIVAKQNEPRPSPE